MYFFHCVVPMVHVNNITVYESDGIANVSVEISGPLYRNISMSVTTVDGTAYG